MAIELKMKNKGTQLGTPNIITIEPDTAIFYIDIEGSTLEHGATYEIVTSLEEVTKAFNEGKYLCLRFTDGGKKCIAPFLYEGGYTYFFYTIKPNTNTFYYLALTISSTTIQVIERATVTSVNGQSGAVNLVMPSKVSELENDAHYLSAIPEGSITADKVIKGLPADCTPLKFLESNGTQYINLDFTPNGDTCIDIYYMPTGTKVQALFGVGDQYTAYAPALTNAFCLYHNGINDQTRGYIGNNIIVLKNEGKAQLGCKASVFRVNDSYIRTAVDDTEFRDYRIEQTITINTTLNATLFAINTLNGVEGGAVRIFRFTCSTYENGTYIPKHDMYPVLDKYCKPAMYDTVTQAYYYNDGTGVFDFA